MFYKQDFIRILESPDIKTLASCVSEACSVANYRARAYLVSPPVSLKAVTKTPEGQIHEFGGAPHRSRRSGRAGKESSLGIVSFTKDKKYVLVVARRGFARSNPFGPLREIKDLSPEMLFQNFVKESQLAHQKAPADS
jgi:hypothetical protein